MYPSNSKSSRCACCACCWKLTESEQVLLARLQNGYQLETDSIGGNPVLRRLKDNELLRPANANASTVKTLEQQEFIRPGKGVTMTYWQEVSRTWAIKILGLIFLIHSRGGFLLNC